MDTVKITVSATTRNLRQLQLVNSIGLLRGRRAMLAVSLANLCFVGAWQHRIYGIPLFMPLWSWRDLVALMLNVMAVAGCFYVLIGFAETHKVKGCCWKGLIYCIPIFAIMNLVRRVAFASHHGSATVILMVGVFILFALGLIFWQSKLLRPTEFVLLGLIITFPLNVWKMAGVIRRAGPAPQLASKLASATQTYQRVVWVVFDEMDYGLSFPKRPTQIKLPQFDRLRSESLFATAAHQPGPETDMAMPTLITGKTVYNSQPGGPQSLRVKFSSERPAVDWASATNVFTDVRAAHLNVGVVGWALPYCRVFHSFISECHWEPMYSSVSDHPAFWASIVDQLDALTLVESRMRGIQRLKTMVTVAEVMVADPDLSMVLIHLPVPHGPPIYDRRTQRITPFNLRKDWFFDNVLLADRALGEIRGSMEASKQWDSSVLIVTSDHSLREYMMPHPNPTPLVPFMVKMPGQTSGTTFNASFDTVITRQLIGALIRREVTSTTLPEWLRQHAETTDQGSSGATP